MKKLHLRYTDAFEGESRNDRNEHSWEIGMNKAAPYELALSGMVSCFYSTFMDVAVKKRLIWESVDIDLDWEKDTEHIPQYLKSAVLNITVKGAEGKETRFLKSFELAAKYCSLYQTFSKVAELSWNATIEEAEDKNKLMHKN